VFGAPGSGKSFIVRELATHVLGKAAPFLEFNLSQLSREDELIGMFHRVRDEALRGRTPFVFWDEFDSQEYRWLQHLLAPMQDGAFQEGQVAHPIGKCVFVFAGGTAEALDEFGPPKERPPSWKAAEFVPMRRSWELRKGPDFKSRLQGHLDVLGPNRRTGAPKNPGGARPVVADDVCFPIRRAFILRDKLGVKPYEPLAIDRGLLDALLCVERFENGARSFEKIAVALRRGGLPARRATLPPREVLAREIGGLAEADEVRDALQKHRVVQAERDRELAAVLDALEDAKRLADFAERLRAEWERWTPGYYAALTPEAAKFDLRSREAAVGRIPEVLAAAGLRVAPRARSARPPGADRQRARLVRFIEAAAATEHRLWVEFHVKEGWSYADIKDRDVEKRLHPALVPYEDLGELRREKNRRQVLAYLEMVRSKFAVFVD
jgi:hypothetical protein